MSIALYRVITCGIVAMVAIVGCGGTDRPDTATWLSSWEGITSVVPDQADLGDPPDAELCEATLASVRSGNEDLRPSPSVTVDDLVTEWVAVAEATFFDCPPKGEDIDSFSEAYEEMGRIEESVEIALSDDQERP